MKEVQPSIEVIRQMKALLKRLPKTDTWTLILASGGMVLTLPNQ